MIMKIYKKKDYKSLVILNYEYIIYYYLLILIT